MVISEFLLYNDLSALNRNSQFDKDFLDFNSRLENIADKMKTKLETSYDCIWDSPHSFQYIEKFKRLSTVIPVGDISEKYERMIGACRAEVDKTWKYFLKNKERPNLPRKFPEHPGRVCWVRSLVNKLKYFLDLLQAEEGARQLRSYRALVAQYNKVGVAMMRYELRLEQKPCGLKIRSLESMLALPVVRSLPGGGLEVNFDPVLQNFLEENKKLMKLDIKLPSTNRFLIAKKDWLYSFRDHIGEVINCFVRASEEIHPDLSRLFSPFQARLRASLEPTLSEISWTYQDWQDFCDDRLADIRAYQDLVRTANDIYLFRLEKTLESLSHSHIPLYGLPTEQPWSLQQFLQTVKTNCRAAAAEISRKNEMVEEAVEDIIELAGRETSQASQAETELEQRRLRFRQSRGGGGNTEEAQSEAETEAETLSAAGRELRRNCCRRVIDKLTLLIKHNLRTLARHFERPKEEHTAGSVIPQLRFDFEDTNPGGETVFVLNAFLDFPGIEVSPSVEEVQAALNSAGKIIISIAKGVGQWRMIKRREGNIPAFVPHCESRKERKLYNPVQSHQPLFEEQPANFFKVVSESKETTKSYSLLTSCLSKFSVDVVNINTAWSKYSDIWTKDKEEFQQDLISEKPGLAKYENLLMDYKLLKCQMREEEEVCQTGRFQLSSRQLKRSMMTEVDSWITLIAKSMLARYKSEMKHLITLILDIDIKFDRAIVTLDDIRIIMETQKKLREMEIDVEMQIETIREAFRLASVYDLQMEKTDLETCQALPELWLELLNKGLELQVMLLTVQEHFQADLLNSLAVFQSECEQFCAEYNNHGPMQPGLLPRQASDRLEIFQNQFDALWRKHGSYSVGEDLFGLEHTEQPGLNFIKKELNLLQRLYKLYNDVIDSVEQYHNILWTDINIEEINNELMEFGNRCRKLPKALKVR